MNRRIISFILLLAVCLAVPQGKGKRGEQKDNNIYNFLLSGYTISDTQSDSIRILTYIVISNHTLQFVKEKGQFVANFDAFLSLNNKEGEKVGSATWKEKVNAENYLATTASSIQYIHYEEFKVLPGEYTLVAEVMDKDTKQSGIKKKELNLKGYGENIVLFDPFFIDYADGNWGLGEKEIPLFTNRIAESGMRVSIFLSGKVEPGEFNIDVTVRNGKKTVLWEKSFQLKEDKTRFQHRVIIPKSITLKGLKKYIDITLRQGRTEKKESLELMIAKPGVSTSVENLSQAVQHMRYILHDKEWKKLSKSKNQDQETLFLEYWAKRDPTPDTPRNELMDEYFGRIQYANDNFHSYQPGWKTDFGMIYILFGPPDDIEKYNDVTNRRYTQRWHYYKINRYFDFLDENGFGDYRLTTPFFRGRNW